MTVNGPTSICANCVMTNYTGEDMEYEGYVKLAHAIIAQAAQDYKTALKELKEKREKYESLKGQIGNYYDREALKESIRVAKMNVTRTEGGIRYLEKFFASDWCQTLSMGADMSYILKKLKEE